VHNWFFKGFKVGNIFPCVFVFSKQLNPKRETQPLVKTSSSFPGFLTVIAIRSDSCGKLFPVFSRVSISIATKVLRAKYLQEYTQQRFVSEGPEVFDPDGDNRDNFTEGIPSRTEVNTVVFSNGGRAYGVNESYAMDMRYSSSGHHTVPKWRRTSASECPDWVFQRNRLPSNPNNLGILQYAPRCIRNETDLKYVLQFLSKKVFGKNSDANECGRIDHKEAFYFNVRHRFLFPSCYPPKIPSNKDICKKPSRGLIAKLAIYMVRLEVCYIFKKFDLYPGLTAHVELNDDIICLILGVLNVMDSNCAVLPCHLYGVPTKEAQSGNVSTKRKRETKLVF
jgi:hypothetical protein